MKVSYDKTMREKAKALERGLITVEVVSAKGGRTTIQFVADADMVKYVQGVQNRLIKRAAED